MKKATLLFMVFVVGGYHLFIFCTSSGIPIPLDLFTTGSALLIFGITTILTTVSIGLTPCVLLGITPSLQESRIYQELFYINNTTDHIERKNTDATLLIKGLKHYCFLFMSTITFLTILTIFSKELDIYLRDHFVGVIFIEVFISSLIFNYRMLLRERIHNYLLSLPKKSMLTKRLTSYITIVVIKTVWIFSICVTIFWTTAIFKIENDAAIIGLLILTATINCIFLIPKEKSNYFQLEAQKYNKRSSPTLDLLKNTYAPSVFILLLTLLLLLLHPMVVERTSAMTLKMLRLGGNVTAIYYFNPKDKDDLPVEIVGSCKENETCKTKVLKVAIDIGNTFYARSDELIYSLPRSKFWLILPPKKNEPANSK